MSTPVNGGVEPELFDRMLAEARAAFTLAAVGSDAAEPVSERERALVEAAIAAGIVGAINAQRVD